MPTEGEEGTSCTGKVTKRSHRRGGARGGGGGAYNVGDKSGRDFSGLLSVGWIKEIMSYWGGGAWSVSVGYVVM